MKTDKVLLCLNSLKHIESYKKLGISNFLFPLENFSIGYKAFSLEEIEKSKVNAYLLINRILTDNDIDLFLKLKIPQNVIGLIIEDTGLFYALKDHRYKLINFQNHLNNNYKTINYWLNYFDSVVMSTDITLEEMDEILKKSKKSLIINAVGYPMIMYSRRNLVNNYFEHYDLKKNNELKIKVKNSDSIFRLVDSNYGTAVFDNNLLDIREYLSAIDDDKVLFYIVNSQFMNEDEVIKAIVGDKIENSNSGFLHKKTIYRIGDLNDRTTESSR